MQLSDLAILCFGVRARPTWIRSETAPDNKVVHFVTKETIMDLNQAIEKHAEWKVKFRSAISKHETMDAETISKDNCCELGKWLHGESKTKFGKLASHSECVSKHSAFHVEAGKVARTINSKKYTEAEAMLGAGTPYGTVSSTVGVAIMHLKKEAGL